MVADQDSLRCQNCQQQFSTVTGRKVHQTRFCKAGLSKNVVDKSKFEQLEASLTCDKCERKFKTVNGRKVHQSRYCGKPKAVATRVFSCKVQDVLGNEFENIEAFKYLGSYVSLKHGDLQEVNCKLQKVDNGLLTSKISGRASSSACTSSAICTKHSFYQPCCTAQRLGLFRN